MQLLKAIVDTQKASYRSIGAVNAADDLELELEVKMNGKPIEFINPECELLIKKADKNKVRQLKDIRYEDGKFRIKVDEQGVTYPGIVTNQLVINDEGRVSTCLFYFMVGTSLDREVLQSISKVEILEQLDEYVVQAFANLEEYEKRIIASDAFIRNLNYDMIAAEKVRDAAEAKRQENYNTAEAGRNTKYASSETDRDNRYREAEDSRDQLYLQEKIARNNKFNLEKEDRENNFNALKTKMEDATNTSKTEEGKRAVVFSDLREAMEFLKATMTQNNNDMVDNEAERIAAELQRQANFETMQQENNSFKERIDAQYETLINENNEFKQEVIDGQVIGERLLAHYVHNSNKEIHFIQFDFETGIGTTSEPHGIVTANEILIAPNDWTLENRNYNCRAVPIEWTRNNDRIKLVRIDDHTLKVTKNDGITIIPVDLSNISNKFVDVSNFHFEIPYAWNLTNFPFDTTHIRILIKGYIKSAGQYRYTSWNTIDFNGREVRQSYLNLLGAPYPNNAGSTHCVFGIEDWTLDFRDGVVRFNVYSVFEGRRAGYENIVWDTATENTYRIYPRYGEDIKRLSRFGTYSDHYAYTSNGTHIYIYDLGGSK